MPRGSCCALPWLWVARTVAENELQEQGVLWQFFWLAMSFLSKFFKPSGAGIKGSSILGGELWLELLGFPYSMKQQTPMTANLEMRWWKEASLSGRLQPQLLGFPFWWLRRTFLANVHIMCYKAGCGIPRAENGFLPCNHITMTHFSAPGFNVRKHGD